MVHFKLTAAAAALLAPTVMGAAPTCLTTDKYVVQMCDYAADTDCASASGVGCTNFVSGDCKYVAPSKYLKMSAVTTGGVVTFSQFTAAGCASSAADSDASVTRVTWITSASTAGCITTTASGGAEATDIMFGETAVKNYTYEMHCAAKTTVLSQSAAIIVYTALDTLDCSTSPSTAITDAYKHPVVASTATAGFCTRSAAAESIRTKCNSGALEIQGYASKDCTGTAVAHGAVGGGTYKFTAKDQCNDGCAWAGDSDCYTGLSSTDVAAAAGSNVIPKKSGATICTTLTNVAPSPSPSASPAGIASAALAAVVGLGYLFF